MIQPPLRIVFAGTPEFAATHLQTLLEHQYEVIAVLTQPDRPAGRGKKLLASPVKQLALQHNIPVLQPESLKDPIQQGNIAALNCDLMIVVAYGLILPQAVLSLPKLGCFNIHGSLLPKWRGAAPIQRAIWAGDSLTGITVMQMDKGLDTGPILLQQHCKISPQETSASLYNKLAILGSKTLIESLKLLEKKELHPLLQDHSIATHAQKLSKEEALLDWSLTAQQLERQIRAFNPWPISYFLYQNQTFKVWEAEVIAIDTPLPFGTIITVDKSGLQIATGKEILNILTLQPAGKNKMSIASFLNSRHDLFTAGTHLND